MDVKTIKRAFPYVMKSKVPMFIWGMHGIGKSSVVKQIANDTKYIHPTKGEVSYGFIDRRLGNEEVGDLKGLPLHKPDGHSGTQTTFAAPEWWPKDPDSKGILFLDELLRAPADILQAAFSLLLGGNIGDHHLPKGWYVVAAGNYNNDDYIQTNFGDEAFWDRLLQVQLKPTISDWMEYAESINVDSSITMFARMHTELLIKNDVEKLEIKPSFRSAIFANDVKKTGIPNDLFLELLPGLFGNEATLAYRQSLVAIDKPFEAVVVLDEYRKIKPAVIALSSGDVTRIDILNKTCGNLYTHFSTKGSKISEMQRKNFTEFLLDIPAELTFDTCRKLGSHSEMIDIINSSPEIVAAIKKARQA